MCVLTAKQQGYAFNRLTCTLPSRSPACTQSFYQLFWMFFCLYALPLTINRYAITSSDTFYGSAGLTNQLQGQFSYNTSDAVVGNVTRVGYNTSAYVANVISYCGFPAGGQFVATSSPQCWLYRDIWSGVTPAQQVPTDMRLAICGAGTTSGCAFYDQVTAAQNYLSDQFRTAVTDDYKRPLSVLFNAFIMCQVGGGCVSSSENRACFRILFEQSLSPEMHLLLESGVGVPTHVKWSPASV